MKKLFSVLAFLVALAIAGPAWAAACSTIPMTAKRADGTVVNFADQTSTALGSDCVLIHTNEAYQTVSATLQSSVTGNANGSLLTTNGHGAALLTVNCSGCSGGTTVNFEGSEDASNFAPIMATRLDGSATSVSTTVAGVSLWQINTAGLVSVRARVGAYSAGTVTVTGHASPVPASLPADTVYQGGSWTVAATQSGAWTVSQTGTWTVQPGNTANTTPWLTRPSDGTNNVNVKASGTSAITTDPALVVALSPNPGTVCTSKLAISQTASTDVLTSTNKIHICSIDLVSDTAQFVSITEGTGSLCATGASALWGSTTVGNGMSFAAQGGMAKTAARPFGQTQTTADHLCILQSGVGRLSGNIMYTDHN